MKIQNHKMQKLHVTFTNILSKGNPNEKNNFHMTLKWNMADFEINPVISTSS